MYVSVKAQISLRNGRVLRLLHTELAAEFRVTRLSWGCKGTQADNETEES